MPRTGFEPARVASLPPQSSASANSATWAHLPANYTPGCNTVEGELYHGLGSCCTISPRSGGVRAVNKHLRERKMKHSENTATRRTFLKAAGAAAFVANVPMIIADDKPAEKNPVIGEGQY